MACLQAELGLCRSYLLRLSRTSRPDDSVRHFVNEAVGRRQSCSCEGYGAGEMAQWVQCCTSRRALVWIPRAYPTGNLRAKQGGVCRNYTRGLGTRGYQALPGQPIQHAPGSGIDPGSKKCTWREIKESPCCSGLHRHTQPSALVHKDIFCKVRNCLMWDTPV